MRLAILAALAFVAGCGSNIDVDVDVTAPSRGEQAISGGTADVEDKNVVDIVWQSAAGFEECSGSLIAPNLVLTAHHCVSTVLGRIDGGAVTCQGSSFDPPDVPANFRVSTQATLSQDPSTFHDVASIDV